MRFLRGYDFQLNHTFLRATIAYHSILIASQGHVDQVSLMVCLRYALKSLELQVNLN